jgi:hypothetical protein
MWSGSSACGKKTVLGSVITGTIPGTCSVSMAVRIAGLSEKTTAAFDREPGSNSRNHRKTNELRQKYGDFLPDCAGKKKFARRRTTGTEAFFTEGRKGRRESDRLRFLRVLGVKTPGLALQRYFDRQGGFFASIVRRNGAEIILCRLTTRSATARRILVGFRGTVAIC